MVKRCTVVMFLMLVSGFSAARAACPAPTIFDGIVKVNVDKEGYVNYDAVRINKGGDLYEFISFIEDADIKGCNDNDRLAFWINAYNAHMVRLVLARIHLKSIDEDFALFGEKFKVAGHKLSLNDIEHRVLRSSTKHGGPIEGVSLAKFEPRVHFALVSGALGSPNLHNRAYQGATLESMLQAAAVNFVNSPKHVRLDGGTLYVSSLFRWYAEDFARDGGPGAGAFIAGLLDPKLRPDAPAIIEKLKTDFPELTQFRYDWTLNTAKNKPVPAQ